MAEPATLDVDAPALHRVVSWRSLASLTAAVVGELAWSPVGVYRLPMHREGDSWGHVHHGRLYLATRAPLWVVPHELAHISTGPDHGEAWRVEYRRLLGVTLDVLGVAYPSES